MFGIRLDDGRVTARLKTGYLVGASRDDLTTIGGASPGAVAAGTRFIYVANATNDTITVIDSAAVNVIAFSPKNLLKWVIVVSSL